MDNFIKKVAIVGAGFLGTEIASRALISGYNVSVFDINSQALSKSQEMIELFVQSKCNQEPNQKDPAEIISCISFHEELSSAVKQADLVVEAVVEDIEIKKRVFAQLDEMTRPAVILASNSSSIPISRIEEVVGHKDRIINLHFSAPIETCYFVDVMRGTATSDKTVEQSISWLKSMSCLPLVCKKESIGFVFNRVWHAARREALKVWDEGYADFRDIDKAWMLFSGMPLGPFGIMDVIGLDIVYSVQNFYLQESGDVYFKPPEQLKTMVDNGDLGLKSGKGFYTWPDAECVHPDFLKV